MTQKNLQVRLNEKLQRQAEKVFRDIGIDTPTAIRVFLTKVVDVGGIPFALHQSKHAYTAKQIKRIDAAAGRARRRKNVSASFSSMDDLLNDLRR